MNDANWSLIPQHCRAGLAAYIEHGRPVGDFLTSVLCNDLEGAVHRADRENRAALVNYVVFLHNYAPRPCWGSPERVKSWSASGGLRGQSRAAANPELRIAG